jgi:hypothetical protein
VPSSATTKIVISVTPTAVVTVTGVLVPPEYATVPLMYVFAPADVGIAVTTMFALLAVTVVV